MKHLGKASPAARKVIPASFISPVALWAVGLIGKIMASFALGMQASIAGKVACLNKDRLPSQRHEN